MIGISTYKHIFRLVNIIFSNEMVKRALLKSVEFLIFRWPLWPMDLLFSFLAHRAESAIELF